MRVNFKNEIELPISARDRMVAASFDVPYGGRHVVEFDFDAPIEDREWSIGLIVGPSGCGKTSILRNCFGVPTQNSWPLDTSVVSSVRGKLDDVTSAFSSVGFNTIPAWLRPFHALSNGEQFRVDVARTLVESEGTIVLDEFTSVVDRQVALLASNAIQKYVRAKGRKLVVATCHYDVEDWLQPDWVLEPASRALRWRSLQRRPTVDIEIGRVERSAWNIFSRFHYLTAEMNNGAKCFAAFVRGRPVAFLGAQFQHHPIARDIVSVSRLVTLPDWQGLGLAMRLASTIGSAYKTIGLRLHTHPAHPSLVRSFSRSPEWRCEKPAVPRRKCSKAVAGLHTKLTKERPCATFAFVGEPMDETQARLLLGDATYKR